MKLFKIKSLRIRFFLPMLFTSISSWAFEPMLEPLVGLGATALEVDRAGYKKGSDTNVYAGVKLGANIIPVGSGSLFASLDYRMTATSTFNLEIEKVKYDRSLFGANLGLDFPWVRVWMSHYFEDRVNFKDSVLNDYKDTGSGIGISYRGAFPWNVSLEFLATNNSEFKVNTMILSLGYLFKL